MRLILSGGGTGGHVYPALTIASALRRELAADGDPAALDVLYVGLTGGAEADIVAKAGFPMRTIASGPVRGKAPWEMAASAAKMALGVRQAQRIIDDFQPHVVLSTGGYASVPVAVAARTRGVPVAVYLPDLYPGWAVRVLARLARRVAVSAIESLRKLPAQRTTVTGYPVRDEFWQADREGGRRRLGLNPDEKVLLVAGGSTGAHNINRAVAAELNALLELCEVVHVSGANDYAWLQDVRAGLPDGLRGRYHLYSYLHEDLAWAMAAADLALCRAGASVLGELPAVGLPAVLVPLPISGGHQRPNARYLQKHGAAEVLEEHDLHRLLPVVGGLLHDEARLQAMREASRRLARPDAAARIARMIMDLAGVRPRAEVTA